MTTSGAWQDDRPAEVTAVPFQLWNRQIHVPVTIDGKGPYWFIVDTGASVGACVDESVLEALNLAPTGEVQVGDGSGLNDRTVPTIDLPKVALGNTIWSSLPALVGAYERAIPDSKEVRLGILGLEAFERLSLVIDYPAKELRIQEGSRLQEESTHDVELEPDGDVMVVLAIGETRIPAVVDTGSSSAFNLPSKYVGVVPTTAPPVRTGTARTRMNSYDILSATLAVPLVFAGHRFEDQVVTFNDLHQVAIVGAAALEDFRITIELANHRARFERAAAEPTAEESEEG